MPRFDHLEFGSAGEPEDRGKSRSGEEARDQHHWIRQAEADRRQGHYENALRYYSRALEVDRSLIRGWVGQVQMLVVLGECPEAELWSRKALELFRNHPDLLAGRAQAVCRADGAKKAQPFCDAALQQTGESAYRWTVRGELLIAGKEATDRYCFDKALACDSDWLVPLEIGLIYLHYRQPSKGLARVRQAVERAPDAPYAWYVQGLCEKELGLNRPARVSFQRCLELSPRHREAEERLTELDQSGLSLGKRIRRLLGLS